MADFALLCFVLAAGFNLYSTVCFLMDCPPSMTVILGRTSLALVAFGVFLVWLMQWPPEVSALYGIVVFAIVALGGGLLRLVPHVFNRALPGPVIVLQSLGAFAGYGLILYSFLGK